MESQLRRQQRKIYRNLNGIRNMTKLPGVLVVIDVNREMTALREARKLGIPAISLIDTDGDPDMVDIPIPGNDDSMRSIDVMIRELCKAVVEGKQQRPIDAARKEGDSDAASSDRRRSRRAQYRADDASPPVEEAPTETAQVPAPSIAPTIVPPVAPPVVPPIAPAPVAGQSTE